MSTFTASWDQIESIIKGAKGDATKGISPYNVGLYGGPGTGKSYCAHTFGIDKKKKAATVTPKGDGFLCTPCNGTGKRTRGNCSACSGKGILYSLGAVMAAETDVFTVYMTEETPAYEVRGSDTLANDNGVPVAKWADGPGIMAWRHCARLVVNEINDASGDAEAILMALTDNKETARITLPSGETVTPEDGFHCIATMNGHPSDLREALADRFLWINVTEPNPNAIASLPEDLQDLATACITTTDAERKTGFRSWSRIAALREVLSEEEAIGAEFGWMEKDEPILDAVRMKRNVPDNDEE